VKTAPLDALQTVCPVPGIGAKHSDYRFSASFFAPLSPRIMNKIQHLKKSALGQLRCFAQNSVTYKFAKTP
jgi:hypothetical protein